MQSASYTCIHVHIIRYTCILACLNHDLQFLMCFMAIFVASRLYIHVQYIHVD